MIAAHIKGDTFFSQNFVEFLAFGESLDGALPSISAMSLPGRPCPRYVSGFPRGFDEVDCYSLASFHTLGGVVVSPMIALFSMGLYLPPVPAEADMRNNARYFMALSFYNLSALPARKL